MGFLNKLGGKIAVVAGLGLASFASFAEDPAAVTIPDVGVDLSAYATQAITTLGGIVAVVVGGTIAFILIRSGIRWIRGMK